MDRLTQAKNFRLTLISAPAGFGKTTLLSQWVSIRGAENSPKRVAWVSLENECDLRRFWTYITTALSEIQPGIGKSAFALFDAPQPNFYAIVRTLINEIADEAKEFLLILDDYHHIDDASIHATLNFFILYRIPRGLLRGFCALAKSVPEGAKFRNTPSACGGDRNFEDFASLLIISHRTCISSSQAVASRHSCSHAGGQQSVI
ncbi:MAG: AAA family ATPase [Anaerolineales bacterium]|jgi:hypothetical protein